MAIDAPIVLHTHIGQRPCEIEVDRRFGRFHVPSRTANLAVYPDRPILFCFKFAANAAFTVATVRFEVLFVLVVLAHDRRRVRHFNITAHPAAAWTAQQIVEAFPWETAQRSLLRDRDGMYGADFRERVASMGIEEVLTAPRSPWQSPYVERVIGSIRRACLDNVVVLHERHLRRILAAYFDHYHRWRCHQGSTWTARSRGRSSRPSRAESSRSPKATVSIGTNHPSSGGWPCPQRPDHRAARCRHAAQGANVISREGQA